MKGLKEVMVALAKNPGGFHSSAVELGDWIPRKVNVQGQRMVKRGELFSAKLGHKHVRYFGTKADRDAYIHKHATDHLQLPARIQVNGNAPWPADAPMHFPEAGYVHTICPSAMPRFAEFRSPCAHGFPASVAVFGGSRAAA